MDKTGSRSTLGVGNMSHGSLKFKYFEKATKFETIFHLFFDVILLIISQLLELQFFRLLGLQSVFLKENPGSWITWPISYSCRSYYSLFFSKADSSLKQSFAKLSKFTQNGPWILFWVKIWVILWICSASQAVISFSAWEKSCDSTPRIFFLEHKMRHYL